MNYNKVILAGRLTADPELRSTATGQSVTGFGLATSRNWTDKDGQKQEQTEFHNIVVWGRTAELVSQYLKKGSLVLLEGRLQTRSWDDKDGNKRKTTEVVAEFVQFGPRTGGNDSFDGGSNNAPAKKATAPAARKEEDIPVINLDEDDNMSAEIPF